MKRGQAWGFDLIIASMLFIIGIIVFFLYSMNTPEQATQKLDELKYEGELIASDILSEGVPENWNIGNVQKIGISSTNKINETKLEMFYNLTVSNYTQSKIIFNTKYEYFINFSQAMIINSNQLNGIGQLPIDTTNLVKITRFTIYKDKPTTLNVFIWE